MTPKEWAQELIRELLKGYGYETKDSFTQGDVEGIPDIRLCYSKTQDLKGEEQEKFITLHIGGGRRLTLRDGLEIDPASVSCRVDIEDLSRQIESARKWLHDS